MKAKMNLLAITFLLAIPAACQCETFAYSPSITGQPLIFHITSAQAQPSQLSAVTWTQLENILLIRSSYSLHLDNLPNRNCCCCCQEWNVWADGMGQWQKQDSRHQNQIGFEDFTGGVSVGADTYFNDFLLGVAFSYTHTNLNWQESAGDAEINSYYGGIYGSWNNDCFYVNTSIIGAYSDYETSRHLHFGRIDRHARADHNGWEALTGIEAGLALFKDIYCSMDFVPFARLDYIYLSQDEYTEEGARSLNRAIRSRNDQLLQSEIGFQFMRQFRCNCFYSCWNVAPNLSLSYINQSALSGRCYEISYVHRDRVFGVEGWNFDRNLGAVALSLNFFDFTETVSVTVDYEGQFGRNYWNQAAHLMCNFCF